MPKRGKDLDLYIREFHGYIRSIAWRCSKKSVVHGADDLAQEATIVLWRIIEEYPSLKGDDLIRLFKVSLKNRLASLFRPAQIRQDCRNLSLERDLSAQALTGHTDFQIDLKEMSPGLVRQVTPWVFYERALKGLELKLGPKFVKALIDGPRQGRNYTKQKEVIRKHMDF